TLDGQRRPALRVHRREHRLHQPGDPGSHLFGSFLNSAVYPNGWYWNYYKHNYNKVLPSFNVKFDLNSDGSLLTRWSASQTLTRQDYNQLAGFLSLSDPTAVGVMGSGTG